MTTKVTVTACCSSNKKVVVEVYGDPDTVLQDGESSEFYVYDDRHILVQEVLKEDGE